MTKAVSLSLGLILLLAATAPGLAQTSPADTAVNEAVLRQANTIILRQKLQDAKNTALRGDLPGAAKLYEDAYTLVEQIGSGIDAEKTQTISGLASTRLALARRAQSAGDLHEAATQVGRVLKVDPQNSAALAFKKDNDKLIASMRGKKPTMRRRNKPSTSPMTRRKRKRWCGTASCFTKWASSMRPKSN
jgi:hypothetical protein